MIKKTFKVARQFNGKPIDLVLVQLLPELSRRKIRRSLDQGGITLNAKKVRIASQKVFEGNLIGVTYEDESKKPRDLAPPVSSKDVIWSSESFVLVNKPPLIPSVPTYSQKQRPIAELIAKFCPEYAKTPLFPCHRLDKETSGVLLMATSQKACDEGMAFFKDRSVKKEYLALCVGIPEKKEWTVECFLSPIDKKLGTVRVVRSGGKSSLTHFSVLGSNPKSNVSLIHCRPHTGRSHQIRVHLASCGLPILGDKHYGNTHASKIPTALKDLALSHHFLHAWKLAVPLSTGGQIFEASLPRNFQAALSFLGEPAAQFPLGPLLAGGSLP